MYIILILLFITKSSEIFNLEIDKSYKFYGEVPNSWLDYPVHKFRLKIPQDMINKNIYVLLIQSNDTRSHIQLYQSESESMQVFIKYERQRINITHCRIKNLDLCQCQSTQLNYKEIYYYLVLCKVSCNYELKVMTENMDNYLNNEIVIRQINQVEGKSMILNLANVEYERFYIRIHQIEAFRRLSIYINMNETIPTTEEFDVQDEINVEGFLFFWNNFTHPINTISILFQGWGYFYYELKTYQRIQEISLYQLIVDKVIKDRVNYYQLVIKDFNDHFLIFEVILQINQKVLIYVQPCIEDRCQINYRNFEWQCQFDIEYTQFIIPLHKMIYSKVYLIAIIPEYDVSYYTFQAKINENIKEILVNKKNYQGILQKDQIALFLLQSLSIDPIEITVNVNYPKGNGIILSKLCIKDEEEIQIVDNVFEYLQNADSNSYYICSITQEQASLISQDILQAQNKFQFIFNSSKNDMNVPKLWFEYQSFSFHYLIAVQSQVDSMRFSLKASLFNPKPSLNLNEFTIIYKELTQQNVVKHQSIIYTQPDQIFSICIATYQGEYNSKYKSQPDNIEKKRVSTLDLDVIQYDKAEGNSYFIQIQARTHLRYSIILIYKKELDAPIRYIPLIQATPFKTFDLDLQFSFEITEMAILYINLKSLQGNFICYIVSSNRNFEYQSFNESNITLTSIEQTLIIENPQQFNYLYVKSTSLQEDESYQIMYYYHSSFLELFLANTFYGQLNDEQKLYFYYQCFYNHTRLYIIRTYLSEQNDQNNLQIYISLNKKCPNELNFQYQIQPNSYYISLPNFSSDTIISIGVYSEGTNKYSLLIQQENSSIELKDNIIQTSPVLEQQNSYFYYVIPKNFNHPIKIQAFTRFNLIELFCNVVEFDSQHNQREYYPTTQNYEIKESFSANPSNKLLVINTTDLIKCYNNGCLLLINTYVLGHFDHFNIMVSSKYTVIRNLEMIIGYSTQYWMSYYYFNIFEHIKDIQISVRAIQDCECDIYVMKSQINTEIIYPSVDQYTYKFVQDTLIISEVDNIGQYMIGVLAQNCIFEVLLHLGGFQMNYIHNGQFVDTFIDNKVQYFYLNNHQEPFRIMIYDMKNIKITINSENKSQFIELANNDDLFGGVIQIDKDICYSCTYVLTLHPIRPSVVSLILTYNTIPLTIKYGRTYYDHCLNTCEFNLQQGELNLFVYSKSIKLTFHSKINPVIKMDLTYSNHIIPINESCVLQIYEDSYYSINLSNRETPIILQLGRVFNGRNTIDNKQTVFIFQIKRIDQEYIIQVSSKSDVIVDVYYGTNTKIIIPKQEQRINKTKRRIIYQFQQIDKQYQIILQCVDDYHIIVDVYKQNQIKYINFNNHYLELIEETQQYNIQAILEQEIQFEKIDCLGKTQLQKISLSFSRDIFFKIQVIDQTYPFPFNIFSLVPHIQYSHDQWYFKNTQFEIFKLSNDSLEVNINTMKRRKTGNLRLNKLIYKIHFSDQENLMKALGCEIDIEFLQNYTGNSIFYNSSVQEVKEKDEIVQFTVLINRELIYGLLVFKAYYDSYDIPYTYFYNISVIYNDSEKMQIKMKDEQEIKELEIDYILIMFGISFVFAVGLICIWMCIPKQKQRRREFNEEIQQDEDQQLQTFESQQLKQKEQELVNIN